MQAISDYEIFKADLPWPSTRELTLCRSLEILMYKTQQHHETWRLLFLPVPPYGRHRPPNTPTSGLTKNVIKSVKGNNIIRQVYPLHQGPIKYVQL